MIQYIVYLNDRKTRFICRRISINGGAVECMISATNEEYIIPLSSIWYIKRIDDGEVGEKAIVSCTFSNHVSDRVL